MSEREMASKRAITINVAVLVVTSILCLLGLEVGLRLLGFDYRVFREYDPVLGVRNIAGLNTQYAREGRARIRINDAGFRDDEWPVPLERADPLVAVVGDSFTFAAEVPEERRFTELLEGRLSSSFDGVRVLNFGVAGTSTDQHLLLWRREIRSVEPDLVILAFYPGNDISGNSRELDPGKVKPYFRLDGSGGLELPETVSESAEYRATQTWWSRSNRTLAYRSRAFLWLRNKALGISPYGDGDGAVTTSRFEAERWLFAPARSEREREAWRLTEALVTRLASEVRATGAGFLLMVVPTAPQVFPVVDTRRSFLPDEPESDLLYVDRRLTELGAREGFQVVALAPRMQEVASEEQVFFFGFPNTELGSGHWNERGHALAARLIQPTVEALLSPPEDGERRRGGEDF